MPSGTAVKTAELVCGVREIKRQGAEDEVETFCWGTWKELDGFLHSQCAFHGPCGHRKVIFGAQGEGD